jgi:hypothetical protein
MNPYASFLGTQDPFAVIESTASQLQDIDLEWSPGPGKWTGRQVLAHLADTEIVFAFRLRQTVAETGHVIQPFDQDAWATGYATVDARLALALFTTVRQWNLAFIKSLPAEAFSKALSHPERGPMTLRTVVETMAGHDLNHLAQLKS